VCAFAFEVLAEQLLFFAIKTTTKREGERQLEVFYFLKVGVLV
jgi:hypothetical protein